MSVNSKYLSAFFSLLALTSGPAMTMSRVAGADALPPPDSMRKYTVQVANPLSRILIASTAFQESKTIQLPAEGRFGPCTAEVKTWSQAGYYSAKLTCQSRTSCFYMGSGPSCSLSFVDAKDLSPSDFLKTLSAEPFTPGNLSSQ